MLNPHRFAIKFWSVLLLELEDLTIKCCQTRNRALPEPQTTGTPLALGLVFLTWFQVMRVQLDVCIKGRGWPLRAPQPSFLSRGFCLKGKH